MSERPWQLNSLAGEETAGVEPLPDPAHGHGALVALSRYRASRILEEARQTAVELQQTARQEGLRQGQADSREQLEQLLTETQREFQELSARQIATMAEELKRFERQALLHLEGRLRELVVAASGLAWGKLLKEYPETLQVAVKDCLSHEFGKDQGVELLVHPNQLSQFESISGVTCRTDANLGLHDFQLNGAMGTLQGSLEARLQHLRTRLRLSSPATDSPSLDRLSGA